MIPREQGGKVESQDSAFVRAFNNVAPCPDEGGITIHQVLGSSEWLQGCNSEVAIELKSWAGRLIRERHQDRRELQTVLYP
jgi:hypothetical protein